MVVLKIEGMSCGHCTAAVEKALKAVPGVESVKVSLEPGEARVAGDADVEALKAAVVEEGYTVQSVE
ncbi:MAG TPA: hypothetical protein EYH03_01090 [Chromatiales bacterium]|nr:hypothetical protein [Chromatiales bacterium]